MSKSKSGYDGSAPVSKMLPAANIYRVGDYVYVETQPSHPYQIRRIEELTKTANGQVEAKVSCFYRRRDLSNALVTQADKHSISAEEDGEIDVGIESDEEKTHQLKHREVFLSRQLEIINANTIRGKCCVTLYSEVETLLEYLEKDDWFYYLLVYDPQQKTLLADRGEIGIGDEYQGGTPDKLENPTEDGVDQSKLETLVWSPDNPLAERQIDQFLLIARSIGTFARALDCGSAIKEPSLHLSAAAASRDITLFHAMTILHNCGYDMTKAISQLTPEDGPMLCRDEMEEWSAGETSLFEEAVKKYGKEFADIQQEYEGAFPWMSFPLPGHAYPLPYFQAIWKCSERFSFEQLVDTRYTNSYIRRNFGILARREGLPWKKISSLVEYYYMWKTTDKYVQQKRVKAAEGDSKVTQIFIPSSNTAINLTLAIGATSQYQVTAGGNLVTPNYMCESCFGRESALWYPWGPSTSQCKLYLCKECWLYWKKYGGLKKTAKASDSTSNRETVYKCRICNKKFNRAERLSNHMIAHKGLTCTVPGCAKSFELKAHLSRHLAMTHSIYPEAKKLKVKTPFHMRSSPLSQISRYICQDLVRSKHIARVPGDAINIIDVKAECLKIVTPDLAKKILNNKKPRKRRGLEELVQAVKKKQKETNAVNVQKPHILPTSHLQTPKDLTSGGYTSAPTHRKLMSPTRSMAPTTLPQVPPGISANLKARTLKSPSFQTNVSGGHKRPLDVTLDQNGIEEIAPSAKRPVHATSPLGRKGFECHLCGKILHNHANLTAHIQMQHGISPANMGQVIHQPDPNRPRTYQPYYDMSVAPPGSNKGAPYVQHMVPVHRGQKDALPNGNVVPSAHIPHQPKVNAQPGVRTGRNVTGSTPQKRQNIRAPLETIMKDGEPHYVDPPQEFFFKSSKEARKSRRSLPSRVQRKIARKPFIQIKCSQELRDAIMCKKLQKKTAVAQQPIVIDDD